MMVVVMMMMVMERTVRMMVVMMMVEVMMKNMMFAGQQGKHQPHCSHRTSHPQSQVGQYKKSQVRKKQQDNYCRKNQIKNNL